MKIDSEALGALAAPKSRRAMIPVAVVALAAAVAGADPWRDDFQPPFAALSALLDRFNAGLHWFVLKAADSILDNLAGLLAAPVTFGERLHWVNIAGFVACAAVALLIYYRGASGWPGLRGFFGFMFPAEYYLHRSARVDYQVFLVNRVLTPVRPLTRALSDTAIAAGVLAVLVNCFGPPVHATLSGFWSILLYTILVALVGDFAGWIAHAAMHRIPLLWRFHRLHHSAEVLTPITFYRIHPVEEATAVLVNVTVAGAFSGVTAYLLLEQPKLMTIFGVSVVIAVFQAVGGNLRHSHIWLSWGSALSRVLISPAQHQIHHSADPRHWNKNYGALFAIWDWMFGTLYVPKEKEELQFGLAGESELHTNLREAYLEPFQTAWDTLASPVRERESR